MGNLQIRARVEPTLKQKWHQQIQKGLKPEFILRNGLDVCDGIKVAKVKKATPVKSVTEKRKIINPYPKLFTRKKVA